MMIKLSKLSWIFFFALPLLFTACGSDDDDSSADPQSIVEIATGDEQFSTLVSALQRVGLVSVLEGDGPFTVFAPNNAAFAASGVNLDDLTDEQLEEVLLYHVLGAKVNAGDIAEGQTYVTTAATTGPDNNQLSVLIEKTGTSVKINNAVNVTTADVEATNGVIHIVDNVILPLDVTGHAIANTNFTTLVSALGDADLVTTLQTDGPFTVFAPLNSAFAEISETVDGLTIDQLEKVLLYHVANGNVRDSDLSNGQEVPSLNSDIIFTIGIDGSTVTVTDVGGGVATVQLTNVQATNGVIHVINKVILPDNI